MVDDQGNRLVDDGDNGHRDNSHRDVQLDKEPFSEGFDQFVRRRGAPLTRFAYLLVADEGRAEDLVQTALVKTWLRGDRVAPEGREAYVRRTMVTTAVSWWRLGGWRERVTSTLPDRVKADPDLVENVCVLVRRARRRRRAAATGAIAALVTVAAVILVSPVRGWLNDSPAPAATVVAQPAAPFDLTTWRWRNIPPPDTARSSDGTRVFVVGRSLVALDHANGHYIASVSERAGEAFGSAHVSGPAVLTNAVTASSDSTLYLWGGQDTARGTPVDGPAYPPSGLAFDVASRTWSALPDAPIASRDGAVAVWTGDRLLVWGGFGGVQSTGRVRADGAVYDPATRTWEILPPAPEEAGLLPVAAVWFGGRLVVWTRTQEGGSSGPDGGRTLVFDPAARAWSDVAGPPVPTAGASLVATAAGPVAVAVIFDQSRAARLDVTAGQWVSLPGPTVPGATICPTSVVALPGPAGAVAVALPTCTGAPAQLLNGSADSWTRLPSWGTNLTGAAGAAEDLLVFWNPAGRMVPGSAASLRVLSPS